MSVDDPLPPEICAQIDPPPVEHHDFNQYPPQRLHHESWRKSSINTNRKSTTRFPTSHKWTMYVVPQRVAQNAILLFLPVKFNFSRKQFATWFLCVKTSSGRVVATSLVNLTVHRWMAGDVSIYQKIALKVTSENAYFNRFRLIVPQPWDLAKKVQLSLIGSPQCAFRRAIDEPCALLLSPPKGGSKREFLHLALPFISSLQVIVDISDLVCGLNIASPSLQMTNRSWNGRGHCYYRMAMLPMTLGDP